MAFYAWNTTAAVRGKNTSYSCKANLCPLFFSENATCSAGKIFSPVVNIYITRFFFSGIHAHIYMHTHIYIIIYIYT